MARESLEAVDDQGHGINARAVVGGVLVTILISLAAALALALVLHLTDVSEGMVVRWLDYLGLLGLALGGGFAARWARSLGWLHGALVGVIYVSLAIIVATLLFATQLGVPLALQRLLIGALAGSIGGMIAISL